MRMKRGVWNLLAWLAVLPLAGAIQDPVPVEGGFISGAAGNDPQIRVYKGIPYAAPPVRELRWREPRVVPSWSGVRAAVAFAPACIQDQHIRDSIYWKGDYSISEDCLYLNIWTPAKSAADRLPVMVWIHGGAFVEGAGSSIWWNGERLARRGVVVVTLNYRLGVFGFFSHPELSAESGHGASGNYGLLDQIAALRWVQRYIAGFGGDAGRVTVFGQSAGGASVCYLASSPLANGLFVRAIGQSGSPVLQRLTRLAEAERDGLRAAEALHAPSLADLRRRRTDEIRRARDGSAPILDGYVLRDDVVDSLAAHRRNEAVALIAGSTENEAGVNMSPTREEFVRQVRQRYGGRAGELLELYPAGGDEEARAAYYALARDETAAAARAWVRLAAAGGKAYFYRFAQTPPVPSGQIFMEGEGARFGAYHGSDLLYTFDNLQVLPWPWTRPDRDAAFAISSFWTNFAISGDPNREGLPAWTPFDDTDPRWMEFGDLIGMRPARNKRAIDLIEKFQMERLKSEKAAAVRVVWSGN